MNELESDLNALAEKLLAIEDEIVRLNDRSLYRYQGGEGALKEAKRLRRTCKRTLEMIDGCTRRIQAKDDEYERTRNEIGGVE